VAQAFFARIEGEMAARFCSASFRACTWDTTQAILQFASSSVVRLVLHTTSSKEAVTWITLYISWLVPITVISF